MPRNGSGSYSLPQPPFAAGTVISSTAMNSDMNDIASALTGSLPRDGQAGMSGQFKATDGSTLSPSIAFSNETNSGFSRASAGVVAVDILGVQVGTFTASGWTGGIPASIPVGAVTDFAGATAPTGWYLCAGGTLSRTAQSDLFAVIGTTYGPGDGLTTFNVPDYRGRATLGRDNMGGVAAGRLTTPFYGSDPTVIGNAGGTQSHTMSSGEIASHFHSAAIVDPGHHHSVVVPAIASVAQTDVTGFNSCTPSSVNTADAVTGIHVTSANGVNTTGSQGSATPFSVVQPACIVNKIIFAGQ